MTKFHGKVGYAGETAETPAGSGVWKESITEITYYGDVNRNTRRMLDDAKVNSDLTVSNTISIVADAYAREHFFAIRYVEWAGTLWTVTTVDVEHPRLLLRLGEVYNGPTP
jgi:hypothetical protein